MKRILLVVLLVQAFANILCAQQKERRANVICGSTFNEKEIKKTDPARYARFMAAEKQIEKYRASLLRDPQGRLINSNSVIIIPVVVHVLHKSETLGTGNNLSAALIQSQIDVLNEDFRRLNADATNTPSAFTSAAADTKIEFRLACVDPDGNPTDGIDRVSTSTTTFYFSHTGGVPNESSIGIKKAIWGGADPWPSDKYLNIWTCQLGGLALGYSTFPEDRATSPDLDGIVVYSSSFGSPSGLSTQGRVGTHEVGHWLGLRHIWGDDTDCSGTDYCADTPNQEVATLTPFGCPTFPLLDGCSTTSPGIMYMNYMDYSDEYCKNMFTNDQATRMRALFLSGGSKESFVDNYFKITDWPDDYVCTTGQLTATNLSCLTVTWSIVSGPATITSGQNTNTVTITATGNGPVVVGATAGGFYDEQEINVGTTPIETITFTNAVNETGFWCSTHINNFFSVYPDLPATYEARLLNYPSLTVFRTQSNAVVGVDPFGSVPSGYYIFQIRATNACGTSGWYETEVEYVDCSSMKMADKSFTIAASPNPTDGELTVTITNENAELKALSRSQKTIYQLFNFDRTSLVKQWAFDNSQDRRNLNVSGLKSGRYILVVIKGKYRQSTQIMIK